MGKRRLARNAGVAYFASLMRNPEVPSMEVDMLDSRVADEKTPPIVEPLQVRGAMLIQEVSHQHLEDHELSEPSTKRQKRASSRMNTAEPSKPGLLGLGYDRIDATGMVPHYEKKSEVPLHLQKYFSQRYRFFSLYDEGCLLDDEGWYSVTPERIADQIAERCRCDVILDAFCGVGGNAIAFAKTCQRVIALDVSPLRLALARHNATIYGVEDRIEFILGDYVAFARSYNARQLSLSKVRDPSGEPYESQMDRKIDVVFLSPPWGGPEYLAGSPSKPVATSGSVHHLLNETAGEATEDLADPEEASEADPQHAVYSLQSIRPIPGEDLFKLSRNITQNIAFYLPRNVNVQEVGRLVSAEAKEGKEKIEIEEEWMGDKLKALTCYFGGLAAGQENMF